MAGVLAFQGYLRVLKDNGDVCSDAKAQWYIAGTTTPSDTYTANTLITANANPVEANALGIFPEMWLSPTVSYKVVITGTGVTTRTIDNVYGSLTINQLENDSRYIGVPGGASYATTGSANAYVVSTGLSLTALPSFSTFIIRPNFTNTGAATLNVDGLGAKALSRNGQALKGGELVSGRVYTVTYDGTKFQIVGDTREADQSGYLYGLTLSNNGSDATNDIDIAAGSAIDSTGAVMIVLAAGITKQLDAAWAVGTNAGGLDTGSIANTTYHVWLIMRSDTGVVDVLFSTSASSPTMPTNYDYKRRIGSIIRESAAIVAFSQDGDTFLRRIPINDVSTNNPGTSAVTPTLSVPAGIKVEALLAIATSNTTPVNAYGLLTSPDQADTVPAITLNNIGTIINSRQGGTHRVRTNTSRQVRYRFAASDASFVIYVTTNGWVDTRGRLA